MILEPRIGQIVFYQGSPRTVLEVTPTRWARLRTRDGRHDWLPIDACSGTEQGSPSSDAWYEWVCFLESAVRPEALRNYRTSLELCKRLIDKVPGLPPPITDAGDPQSVELSWYRKDVYVEFKVVTDAKVSVFLVCEGFRSSTEPLTEETFDEAVEALRRFLTVEVTA